MGAVKQVFCIRSKRLGDCPRHGQEPGCEKPSIRCRPVTLPEAAAQLAVASAGPALVVTTCVLLVGFAILSFSAFQMTSALGLFTALVCAFGLAADLLVLPPLLVIFGRADAPEALPTPNPVAVTDR